MREKCSSFGNRICRPTLALIVLAFLIIGSIAAPASALENKSASFAKLDFVANIETIGVAVSGANLPKTAELTYRKGGESIWRTGHTLIRIDDGRLIGSLFGLSASTSYEIKVRDGTTEISGTVATQADEIQFAPSTILHVDGKAAPGGSGSISAPFKTIREAVNRATPGTQILVADGIYRETVTFPKSGTAGNWIQLKAEGSGAILDGAKNLSGRIWTSVTRNVWRVKIDAPIEYLARDQKRYYKYDDLRGLMDGVGHNRVPMQEGWYVAPNTSMLYVRSLDNPSRHTWQVPLLNDAVDTNGHDWLWVEGFEIRFYGAQYGCGVCMTNASHVVIRKNKIHNVQKGIFIEWTGGENQGNDTRIEYNEIYDPPVNEWPWSAVKATSMEGTGIIIRGHIGAIVRGNDIHNYFNGIYTGSSGDAENSALAFDADIYNNRIHQISDDALEPEGACINQRFRNNTIYTTLVGVSLAPVTKGPVWVLRSTFANYTGRGIKLDRNPNGIVLVYHNSFWTNQKNPNAVDLISAAHNVTMRNNIFQGNAYAFLAVPTGSTGNNWNNNNWYTTFSPRFKWENIAYKNIAKLCAGSGLECNGYEDFPALANPGGGDFALLASSPNIDRGVLLRGINDNFSGKAPDIGAYEFASNLPPVVDPPPAVSSIARSEANPTNASSVNFTVNFSEPVSGVDVKDFSLTASNITGAFVTSVTPVSEMVYRVNINTGDGDGTIRLDIADDDSILDVAKNPLGGIGAGNGNFNTGETYTINKSSVTTTNVTFNSIGTQDGWILESGEFTNKGGTLDRVSNVLQIGDDSQDKQYQSILSFNTDSLPDGAVITSAQVNIKKQSVVGTNPLGTHGNLLVEIRSGPFSGNSELVLDDFSAASSPGSVQEKFAISDPWYTINLNSANLAFINKNGATQFRLFFGKDDNDDLDADYLKLFSGNAAVADQPQLIVTYSIPSGALEPSAPAELAAPTPLAVLATPAARAKTNVVNQPPVITSSESISLPENTTVVTTITATDTETLTYSISGGVDSTLFDINASTGELTFISAPDYEVPADNGAGNIYNVTVQISDGELTASQDVIVTVTPVNDNPPVITSSPTANIAENSTVVTTVIATDADLPIQSLTYSITSGADSKLFNINTSTGKLTFISAPDYEVLADSGLNNVYKVTIQVSDGELTASQDIVVTITPVNDNAPVITSVSSINVAENSSSVITVIATDSDLPIQSLTYSITSGADSKLFNINASTGELTFISAPDYEVPIDSGADNIYNLTVQVSDGELTASQDIAVTVTPVNDNTPVITSSPTANVAENSTGVTTVTATDADLPTQSLTYSITSGADSKLFNINASTGELTFISAPDYEVPADNGADNIYNLTVQVSDGELTASQDVVVTVTPVNDNTPVITSLPSVNVAENSSSVITVTATDSDLPTQSLTYSIIGGADATLFNINASTGELTFISAPDYEVSADTGSDNIYNLTVQVSDGKLTASQDIVVTVTPVNDNTPVITSVSSIDVAENLSSVITVTATDSDLPTQPLTYSIIGGADATLFNINASTGELAFIFAPDYEVPADAGMDNIYNLTVQVSDGELIASQDVVVAVTPLNDNTPVITSSPTANVAENSTAVTTVIAKDADLPVQVLRYAIVGGTGALKFSINKDTGNLTFIAAPDYELPTDTGSDNIYNVTVQASDGELSSTQEIVIAITPVNDNTPVITPTPNISIAENTTAVTIVTSKDADLPVQSLTYTIVGGVDAAKFAIAKDSGILTFIAAPDFESPADTGVDNIYEIMIQVSDGTFNITQVIKVTVTDASET